MKIFLQLFLFLLLTVSVQARLGDTKDQLIARFGKPVGDTSDNGQPGEILIFNKTGFKITVTFFEGHSESETYQRLIGEPLNNDDQQHLLSINSQGQKWMVMSDTEWRRDDGSLAKIRTPAGPLSMMFESKKLFDTFAEAYKKAHSYSMDGF